MTLDRNLLPLIDRIIFFPLIIITVVVRSTILVILGVPLFCLVTYLFIKLLLIDVMLY